MGAVGPGQIAAAFLATTVYYIAFVVFKVSAGRMPPLRGSRPLVVVRHALTDWIWLAGLVVLMIGVVYQIEAFRSLPLGVAQPIFATSLALLLWFAVAVLGERLSGREWMSVALFGLATVLVGVSSGKGTGAEPASGGGIGSPVIVLVSAVPALLVATVVWLLGDRRSGGRHAKPLAGVAYGIGAGVCFGTAELGIKGVADVWAVQGSPVAALATPYPYLVVVMAAVALAQLQISLQRCRISIVTSVLAVTAKTQLVVAGTAAYGDLWPPDPLQAGFRAAGFALAVSALVLFPRHEGHGAARTPSRPAGVWRAPALNGRPDDPARAAVPRPGGPSPARGGEGHGW